MVVAPESPFSASPAFWVFLSSGYPGIRGAVRSTPEMPNEAKPQKYHDDFEHALALIEEVVGRENNSCRKNGKWIRHIISVHWDAHSRECYLSALDNPIVCQPSPRGFLAPAAQGGIAAQIGVSESSVKATLQQLFSKTGVRTRSQRRTITTTIHQGCALTSGCERRAHPASSRGRRHGLRLPVRCAQSRR
jgi:hypothetical protein